ncbi:hypothetical protein ACH4MN_37330 [Streptomyces anulatus]|uniref:hypothetical protein n=1 Tax=Streptomyces TaxID=1883 RepID=UPI001B373083|nr:hypothetical protein [Streptomyces sp. C3-3]MBQ1118382.1 hypothetical protein [Streptomyces sp. C3-3]
MAAARQGDRQREGHHLYDGKVPIVAVGLNNLREHGPTGLVFYRFGRNRPQPLLEAIGNPRRDATASRELEEGRVQQEASGRRGGGRRRTTLAPLMNE